MPTNRADTTEPMVLDVDAILADYQRRQMLEHLVGPGISLAVHLIVFICAAVFFEPIAQTDVSEIEVTIAEMEVKELDPKQLEQLQDLERVADEVVPTVEKPQVSQEVADVATAEFDDAMAQTDDAMDFSSVLDVSSSDTPLKLPSLYGGRSSSGRSKMMKKYGGTKQTESGVQLALRWLKETQNANGSWSASEPDAMAGLGLLTFLAHGETPSSDEYGPTVQKAMRYLTDRMMAVDPEKARYLGRAYTNGIATYALSEAYGLTKIPSLKPAMEQGLTFIVEGQQDNGGFDYYYAKGARWDLSVAGWQVQAMKAGYVAGSDVHGLMAAIERSIGFLKDVSYRGGKFYYSPALTNGPGSMGMQAAGTLCLQLVGEGNCLEARKVADFIYRNDRPVWDDTQSYPAAGSPVYNWYYETQAMFHAGRTKWNSWNKAFSEVVSAHQKGDGHWDSPGKESWTERDPDSGEMVTKTKPEYDPWYATTLCSLSLQVYYRYLPTYKMPTAVVKQEKSILEALDDDLDIDLE